MTTDECAQIVLLLQADHDGELDVGGAASLAAHIAKCPDCQARQAKLSKLSEQLRTEVAYYSAPASLRQAIEEAVSAPGLKQAPRAPSGSQPRSVAKRNWLRPADGWLKGLLPAGLGAAVAAAVILVVLLPRGSDMTESVIASHIRALQPGHLMDVVSTDQHTVKPWFDGRLDYAPPVKDLASFGFPLIGGRLDYLAGRPVAALAYHRAKHVIDLYAWPTSSRIITPLEDGELNGYNFVSWTQDEMTFWAVSDLNKAELVEFVDRWRASQ